MLSTLVIVALQHSRRVFWFSFDHWVSTPWFFSRSRTRLVFSFFFTQKTFFFFLWAVIRDIFISGSWPGFFCFFLVPWILVDIRLVNIYTNIYLFIYTYIYKLATIVEGDPKAPFSIATTPRCRGGRYSIPRIAPLYPWTVPYNAEC